MRKTRDCPRGAPAGQTSSTTLGTISIDKMNDSAKNMTIRQLREQLENSLRYARLSDSVRIKREWNRAGLRDIAPGDVPDNAHAISAKRLLERAENAEKRSLFAHAGQLQLNFPAELPVCEYQDQIVELLKNNQVVIVAGATGSGKTTQLPKMALAAGCGRYGRIGCTQPRRLAASSLARRAAQEMQAEFGQAVGYKVRFDDHTSENTVVKFMTDGILLADRKSVV